VIPAPTLEEQRTLIRSLAPERLRRFRAAVGGGDRAAIGLYIIDAQLASHMHATLRFVEVALRERLHRALKASFGERWFVAERDLFDKAVLVQLDDALVRVGEKAPAGKVIAQLMLGTWVSLLGRGDHKPDGTRASYSADIWAPSLQAAFPGRSRVEVHRLARRLNWARNRINHCEPVVFGFPQPGTGQGRIQVRSAPGLLVEDARKLIGFLDGDLAGWLHRWTEIDLLVHDPLALAALDHVQTDPWVDLVR
jgi:hypothetical protein